MPRDTFFGIPVKQAKPTLKHRPAIWGGILGTVYAMNAAHETHYFDYNYEEALEWAGLTGSARQIINKDPRLAKNKRHVRWADKTSDNPSINQTVLWVLE